MFIRVVYRLVTRLVICLAPSEEQLPYDQGQHGDGPPLRDVFPLVASLRHQAYSP